MTREEKMEAMIVETTQHYHHFAFVTFDFMKHQTETFIDCPEKVCKAARETMTNLEIDYVKVYENNHH